jgi:hypothetical protein
MSAEQIPPCGVGLRCPDPASCDHKFQHPDQTWNRLHPDDWFAEPDRGDYPRTEVGEKAYQDAVATAAPVTARAQWACKLDCPTEQRLACLQIGLTPGPTLQYGVFGGYTAAQRQQIVKEREQKKADGGSNR